MISYEELCQALDKFNRRRRNEAELADLEQGAATAKRAAAGAGRASPSGAAPPKPVRAGAVAGGSSFASRDAGGVGVGVGEQPAEDTHEIDVDEMVVDDK
jgi:hypothetical protein